VLVTLTVFYLILIELIPPTSMAIPLIGRYLLFTMFLVSFSIAISVVTLNFHRRFVENTFLSHCLCLSLGDGTLHTMPRWIYRLFIRLLPKLLMMSPPDEDAQSENDESTTISGANELMTPLPSSYSSRYASSFRMCQQFSAQSQPLFHVFIDQKQRARH